MNTELDRELRRGTYQSKNGRSPRFRIIVPTRNRPEDLARFLEAIVPQLRRRRDFALVIVNDGSHSPAYQAIVARYSDMLTYLISEENLGIGNARRLGLTGASEEYVVTTDDDCIPGPFWLDWIAALAHCHPGADVFAGFTDPLPMHGGWFYNIWCRLPNTTPESTADALGLVTAVGANAVFRRRFLDLAEPLTLKLSFAPEDYHATQVAVRAGASFRIEGQLRTGHKLDARFARYLRRQFRYGLAAAEYAIAYDDRRLSGILGDASAASLLRKVRQGAMRQWAAPTRGSQIERTVRSALGGLAAMGLQFGWYVGVRRFSRDGRAPNVQLLSDQFNRFCVEVSLPNAHSAGGHKS